MADDPSNKTSPSALATPRLPDGRWPTGQSGNPAGRSRADRELAEACRLHDKAGVERLALIVKDGKDLAAIRAIEVLFERGHGKAPQRLEVGGEPGDVWSMTEAEVEERMLERAERILAKRRATKHEDH